MTLVRPPRFETFMRSSVHRALQLLLLVTLAGGCQSTADNADVVRRPGEPRVRGVNINDPVQPVPFDEPIALSAAKNEWASFAVQISDLPPLKRAGGSGRWVAIVLVTAGVVSAVVGYMVRPLKSRPPATQPAAVGVETADETGPAAR